MVNASDALIISIKEARKLLPKHIEQHLTDGEVERIVIQLEAIARGYIRSSVPHNH